MNLHPFYFYNVLDITIPQCQQQVYAKLNQQKERLCPYMDCSQPKARILCRDKCGNSSNSKY